MSNVTEINDILAQYDIGALVGYEKNNRGYVNISYAIETVRLGERKKYFLRRYKRGIKKEELLFEHGLIKHLATSGFTLVADLLETREEKTFVKRYERGQDQDGDFYAIFEFLPGEDRYTWVSPRCSREEIYNAAVVLGKFHEAMSGFSPPGRRYEPAIRDLLPVIARNLAAYREHSKNTAFDVYLHDNLDLILDNVVRTRHGLDELDSAALLQLVIHCDYHPGNLKFQGSQVVGLFDFDWSKMDYRCFDVALALFYFFVSWDGAADGRLLLDEAALFLGAYQQTLAGSERLTPLNAFELNHLPVMLSASNLYVLYWAVEDYCHKDVDINEYMTFLRHGVNFMRWFASAESRQGLQEIVTKLCTL